MKLVLRSTLSISERRDVFELWNNEYPEKLQYKTTSEFDKYLDDLTEQSHILLIDELQKVRGWYFDFCRDNERWFAIILDSKIQGKGEGTKILKHAKEKEDCLSGWVIDHNRDKKANGEMYTSPLTFYLKNGFEQLPEVRLELGKLSAVKITWNKG